MSINQGGPYRASGPPIYGSEGRGWRWVAGIGFVFLLSVCVLPPYLLYSSCAEPVHPPGYDDLVTSIQMRDRQKVGSILAGGVNPNNYPESHNSDSASYYEDLPPLEFAVESGDAQIVRALLDHGADPNIADGTALNTAVQGQQLDVMNLLVAHGAKVNDQPYGSWPLFEAVRDRKRIAVKFLLEHGADPNTAPGGESALQAAKAGYGAPGIIKLLKQAGATR